MVPKPDNMALQMGCYGLEKVTRKPDSCFNTIKVLSGSWFWILHQKLFYPNNSRLSFYPNAWLGFWNLVLLFILTLLRCWPSVRLQNPQGGQRSAAAQLAGVRDVQIDFFSPERNWDAVPIFCVSRFVFKHPVEVLDVNSISLYSSRPPLVHVLQRECVGALHYAKRWRRASVGKCEYGIFHAPYPTKITH